LPQLILIFAGGLFVMAWTLAAGILIAPRAALPLAVRFTSGAVVTSMAIFGLLAAHAGYPVVWITFGAIVIAGAALTLRRMAFPALPRMSWWFRALFAVYGLLYLIYALAPEIQPDAITYHLGLVSEYVRLHALSQRLEFYELLPQGIEMLFVPAFAIGAHSAAKLVHFSFLIATVPLIRHICAELNIDDFKACGAAGIFLLAPVTAITSTSAYTDTALVCCCCAVFYLLIRWARQPGTAMLILAALNAGFCYAIKPTFGLVAVAALAFAGLRGARAGSLALFSLFAAAPGMLWIVRSAMLTGNPFAPFLNAWFPNEAFNAHLEAQLLHAYSALRPSFSWRSAILDYTVLGGNQGMFGPAFLLMPLALLALRNKAGRWLIPATLLLAIPVLSNTGARFLMPAAALGSIALVSLLPGAGVIALLAIQAIGSAPPVIDLYDTRNDWRLQGLPLRAALRLEGEREYWQENAPGYDNDRMITKITSPGAKIFVLAPVHQALLEREVLVYWQSSLADRILDDMTVALDSQGTSAARFAWRWPEGSFQSVRITAGSAMRVFSARFVPASPALTAAWIAWPGGHPYGLNVPASASGAELLIWPDSTPLTDAEAQTPKGEWISIAEAVHRSSVPVDIRRDVAAFIRRSGYRYILASTTGGGLARIGRDLVQNPVQWGVQPAGRNGDVWLFYIASE
jgi:hypothetical protein